MILRKKNNFHELGRFDTNKVLRVVRTARGTLATLWVFAGRGKAVDLSHLGRVYPLPIK